MTTLRVLVGARVSHVQGPEKISHVVQQEAGAKWAKDHGHGVVGTVEDLGVSASISPFARDDLGAWLSPEKAHEWDVLVFSKLDRLFRSTRDCIKFAEWAEQHSKMLVFAEDGLTLNYRDDRDKTSIEGMMAELFVYLGSFFAQLELNRFKSRANDRETGLRQTTRWPSGMPPLGFKVVDHPSGKGKGLGRDPEGYELLHEMARKLLDGWSFVRIADWLNQTGAQSNRSRARAAKGKESSAKWTTANVILALTSPRTQGLKMHRGVTVLDGDGEPIRLAPATFDDDTWKQIQTVAALRRQNQRTPTRNVNPLLGVGYCGCTGCPACAGSSRRDGSGGCGSSLSLKSYTRQRKYGTYSYKYYCCGESPKCCPGVLLRADVCDELLEQTFLERWGDEPVTRRVFVPGEDHSHELEKVNASIERLRRESDAGLVITDDDERVYLGRMRSLIDRRTTLEALPNREAGWVSETTGQTYREAWGAAETAESRRQLLMDGQIRFVLYPSPGKQVIAAMYAPSDDQPPTQLQAAIADVLDDPDAGGFELDDDGQVHPR
jgi:DNA invertase Pin-like site-specific DNA recombinase